MDIATYTPRNIAPQDWAAIREFVGGVVLDAQSSYAARYTTKDLLTHVAAHTDWCVRVGGVPLERRALFDRAVIDMSLSRGFGHLKTTTLATRRSCLLRVAEAVLPKADRTARLRPLRDDKLAMPYSDAELLALRSWAVGQTTGNRRRDCHTILGLGLGAGLTSAEIMNLKTGDIRVDSLGVLVTVQSGEKTREVPVLWMWEQGLVDLVTERDPGDLAVGVTREAGSKNWLCNFIAKTAPEDGLRPNSDRMRNSWLAHHLLAGTQIGPLVAAAGLETFRTIEKLLKVLPEPTREETRRAMRRAVRVI